MFISLKNENVHNTVAGIKIKVDEMKLKLIAVVSFYAFSDNGIITLLIRSRASMTGFITGAQKMFTQN